MYQAWALSRDTGDSPRPFASVVLERLTGWLVLPVISVVGFVVNPGLRHLGTPTRVALGLAFATLAGLVVVLAAVAITGPKLRAVLRYTRFPIRSDW